MTLVITAAAAILVGGVRLGQSAIGRAWSLGVLALIYTGAALMWLVDAIFSIMGGGQFINTSAAALKSDSLLGLTVVGLGLVAWLVYVIVMKVRNRPSDPKGTADSEPKGTVP